MLRDVLVSTDAFATWNCDEIDLSWRYGNDKRDTDYLYREDINGFSSNYIKRKFRKLQRLNPDKIIVEKTCANSLRVDYLDGVFPDARFIFLYRNPDDVVKSVVKKRANGFSFSYTFRKVQNSPISMLCTVALARLWSKVRREKSRPWGPRTVSIKNGVSENSQEEVAFRQWEDCVIHSAQHLSKIDNNRVYCLSYENFVTYPESELRNLLNYFDLTTRELDCKRAVNGVFKTSVGTRNEELRFNVPEIVKNLTSLYEDEIR